MGVFQKVLPARWYWRAGGAVGAGARDTWVLGWAGAEAGVYRQIFLAYASHQMSSDPVQIESLKCWGGLCTQPHSQHW